MLHLVSGMNFLKNFVNLLMMSPYNSHFISHQFIISLIASLTIRYSFSLPIQAQNLPFPEILPIIVPSPFGTDFTNFITIFELN